MKSFIDVSKNSDFSIYNIPFGIFRYNGKTAACTRIGDTIVDLDACQKSHIFKGIDLPEDIFHSENLNSFIGLGKHITSPVRIRIQEALTLGGALDNDTFRNADIFINADRVEMLLPLNIGDYTDFYSSKEHATNVGMMFRDPNNALLPNWLHIPIGYHGRASSIVVSGTDIRRPYGQIKSPNQDNPEFSLSKELDFELEMAFVVGKDTALGARIDVNEAEEYIFGLMLFNDWSARDIQRWEYVPLGPFLGKNFGSTVSPWIVTLEALEPFRVAGPNQEKEVLPYLKTEGAKNYDIHLSVALNDNKGNNKVIAQSNFKYMYWNMCQQLAHHTVNGCNVRIGDLMASGTISGPTQDSLGSMLEITWKGTRPIVMPDQSERKFIHDEDAVIMQGWCEKGEIRIGFGSCEGKVISGL
ncbi:MAG: fumarylacetoacetase [Chitinophagales bacterium]|nr:fumarylacetoacetase [Chitinophagales bacterium]